MLDEKGIQMLYENARKKLMLELMLANKKGKIEDFAKKYGIKITQGMRR